MYPFEIVEYALTQLRVLASNPQLGTVIQRGPVKGRNIFPFRVFRSPISVPLSAYFIRNEDGTRCTITEICEGHEVKMTAKAGRK
jgi:hypothetical protein